MRYALYMVLAIGLLTAAGCAGATGGGGGGTAGTRVAVVDLQKVLLETESGKKARESLNSFMKNRQAIMELEEKDLKRMEDDMIKQASVLTPSARKEREDQLRRRLMEFQQKGQEMNREIQDKQKEVLDGFRDRAEKVVAKVAQQQGVQVVVERGRGGPTVYNEAALDLTAREIEEFNKGGQ